MLPGKRFRISIAADLGFINYYNALEKAFDVCVVLLLPGCPRWKRRRGRGKSGTAVGGSMELSIG